ncbi:MAG: universal stress protein [Pseudomonadota bacterium]
MFKKIMVPVDLRHEHGSDRAVAVAADMGKHYGAEVQLVSVTGTGPNLVAKNPEEYADKLTRFAQARTSRHGVDMIPHTETSNDVSVELDNVLSDSAEKIGADLVVMASHVPGLAEHVFASNAGYLASHASMSVMVVR